MWRETSETLTAGWRKSGSLKIELKKVPNSLDEAEASEEERCSFAQFKSFPPPIPLFPRLLFSLSHKHSVPEQPDSQNQHVLTNTIQKPPRKIGLIF